ncbi:MAG: hypothetical protein VB070_05415 [Clostridiaceae bacterium]|nr:hypothetical protein [Clostridiaceae bacterium]
MIKIIVGSKGSGKTARLVDDLNMQAVSDASNVVCIEAGRRLDRMVKYKIRLVDISEYPVKGYRELLSFIAGISAKDYDLTHVYIDSIFKVANDSDIAGLETFLNDLNAFSEKDNFSVMIMLSAEMDNLPQGIRQYC